MFVSLILFYIVLLSSMYTCMTRNAILRLKQYIFLMCIKIEILLPARLEDITKIIFHEKVNFSRN